MLTFKENLMIVQSKTFTLSAVDIQETGHYTNRNIGELGGVGFINHGSLGFGDIDGLRASLGLYEYPAYIAGSGIYGLYMKNETKELVLELGEVQDEPFFVNITIGSRTWKGNDYDSKDIVYTNPSNETPNRRSIFKWNNGDDIFTAGQNTTVTITYAPVMVGEANFSIGYTGSGDTRKAGYIKNTMGSSRGTQTYSVGSFSATDHPEILGLFVEKHFQSSKEQITLYMRNNARNNYDTIQINSIFLTLEGNHRGQSPVGGAHDPNNLGYKMFTWYRVDAGSLIDRTGSSGGYLHVALWNTNKRVDSMKDNLTPLWNSNVKRTGTWTTSPLGTTTPEKNIGYKRSEGHTLSNGMTTTSLSAKRFNHTKDKTLEELSWNQMNRTLTFSYFTHQETSDELHTVLDYLKIGNTLFHTKQASYTDTGSLSNKRLTYAWENVGSNPFEYYEDSQHTSTPPSERVTPVEAGHYDRSCYVNAAIENGNGLADKTFNVTLQQNEPLVVILEKDSKGEAQNMTDYSFTSAMPTGTNVFLYGANAYGLIYDFQDITFNGNTTTLSGVFQSSGNSTTESIRIYHRLGRLIKINVTLEKNYDPDYTPSGTSEQTLKVPITRTNYCSETGASFQTSNQSSGYPTDYFDRHFLSNMKGVNIRPFVLAEETTSSTFREKLYKDQDYTASLPLFQQTTSVGGQGLTLYGSGVTGWKNGKRLPANFPTAGDGTLTALFQTGYYDGSTNRAISVNLSFSKFVLYNTGASYGLAIKNPNGELRFDADTVMPKIHTVITGNNTNVGQWLQDYSGDYYFSPYEASIYTDSALSSVNFIAEQVLPESRFKTRTTTGGSVFIREATGGSASRNATYTADFDTTDDYVVIVYTY